MGEILDRLEHGIFEIFKENDKFYIQECCDYYRREALTKEELIELGYEIIDYVERNGE